MLGELEARVHADGVAQFVSEDALLAVIGQFEQVEAGGGGGQTAAWFLLAYGEETTEHAAQSVPRVLNTHTHIHITITHLQCIIYSIPSISDIYYPPED